jgi:hypothetical protein
MIAHYNKRIRELADNPPEMYQYMAKSAPFLMEYDASKQKKDLFKKFMEEVENEILEGTGSNYVETSLFISCKKCAGSNLFHDDITSDMICQDCGIAQYTLSGQRSYNEEQDSDQTIVYSYKRENHFNEWLAQFQAKEITNIPPEVFELLRNEFKKQKASKSDITHSRVREFLKKLKLNKYYEHAPYICSTLNGVTPPRMSRELEDKLRVMFHHIQKPFEKHCPSDRKNFLSYSYILYKFCELLSEDEFLVCFPLLKSKEKLYKQDQIWKKITDELKWEYIPTV